VDAIFQDYSLSSLIHPASVRKVRIAGFARKAFFLAICTIAAVQSIAQSAEGYKPSRAAADNCAAKLKILEDLQQKGKSTGKQIRFSQDEVNSYLALVTPV
jgi:hypothetical protein